jgi:hypothetical protein
MPELPYPSADELIRSLSTLSKTESTRKLTQFYVMARFRPPDDVFHREYVDGSNDGGVDYCHRDDNTFFVLQSKFSANPEKVDESSIMDEIFKLEKTVTLENPNKKAEDFINALRSELSNASSVLEIIWLTTNLVPGSTRDAIQARLGEIRTKNEWKLSCDFLTIDRFALDSVIYDVEHGYVPYTGKRALGIEGGRYIENTPETSSVYSVVCTVRVNELLDWFKSSADVDLFLQKNIREYQGETGINKKIGKSYAESPAWFWYKHNGVIIFADSVFVDKANVRLVLRNPQVVNGGQTLKALFSVYNRTGKKDSDATVLIRAYRLPYEDTSIYQKSIDIISALNSQNPIRPSDLRSTDPRQVKLEEHFRQLSYVYYRKRSMENRVTRFQIKMTSLGMVYYVCKKQVPQEGVRGNIEEIFNENTKYDEVFPVPEINLELKSSSHIAMRYLTAWNLSQNIRRVEGDLPKRDAELSKYTRHFVLANTYRRMWDWKQASFELKGWRSWKDFVESRDLEGELYQYIRKGFAIGREIIPASEDGRNFLRKKEASQKYETKTSVGQFNSAAAKAYKAFGSDQE